MAKEPKPTEQADPAPAPEAPPAAEHKHDHEHPDKPHKHDTDHPTRAELDEYKRHKHEPEKPTSEAPTPALIDKPPPEVKPEKKERVGRGLFF